MVSKVAQFRTRDRMEKEELKRYLCECVDTGDSIIIVSHQEEADSTECATNIDAFTKRIFLRGLLMEGILMLDYTTE